MNRRILVALLLLAGFVPASAQFRRPTPAPAVPKIIALPPCDIGELMDLLDQWYIPEPESGLQPDYCAPRTCELQAQAKRATRDAKLSQSIDLMRMACRGYYR